MGGCNAGFPKGDVEVVENREVHVLSGYMAYDQEGEPPKAKVDSGVALCKMGCGKPVQPGKTRKGNAFDTCCRSCVVNPGLGFHDPNCGGQDPDAFAKARPACDKGARCRTRTSAHLKERSHPLDQDYALGCVKEKIEPEPLSLKAIFDWADADGSGNISREELKGAFEAIKGICKDHLPDMTDAAWASLDEDGNGVLNFMEFASWAGPRLGLPLGVVRTARTVSVREHHPCQVIGCPCEDWAGPESSKTGATCSGCKHKREYHKSIAGDGEDMPFPEYWQTQSGTFNYRLNLTDSSVPEFQQLFDKTYLKRWTRDRTKHNPSNPAIPSGFKVVSVRRNENSTAWREYGCHREDLLARFGEDKRDGESVTLYEDVKTMRAFREVFGARADRLVADCNEWYLFHGTHPDNAEKIMDSDFRVGCAGANTGTLYGKGLYFAECVTKADEYAKPNRNGNYSMLLCRVIGGIVRYTDMVEPDPEDLVQSCLSGRYTSVMGDREKCRGTFREFVLFDSENVYPEYEIEYKRIYD